MGGISADEHENVALDDASPQPSRLNIDPFFRSIDRLFETVFAQHGTEETPSYPSHQTLRGPDPLDSAYGPYEIIAVDDSQDTTHNA